LKGAVIGKLRRDGSVSVDESERRNTEELPNRASRVFSLSTWTPAHSMFRARKHADQFTCSFESMWGYAVPCRTFGFYEGVSYKRNFFDSSYAWIGEQTAGFIFDIEPSRKNYKVIIDSLDCVSPSRRLGIKLNGTSIFASPNGPAHIEAIFSSELLQKRNNVLELDTELNDKLGLSFALKSVLVRPDADR